MILVTFFEADRFTEDKVTSLFQPDSLLSAEFYDTFRRKTHLEPEKRLMLAVLEDAIICFQRYVFARDYRQKSLFREAEQWILEDDGDAVFSFENTCEVLGVNPNCLRQGLLRRKERELVNGSKAQVYRLSSRVEKRPNAMITHRRAKHRSLRAAEG
ncbi:MAG: hypothetical protein ACE5HC_13715 [Candidatus Binatia bacterium]